MRTNGVQQNQGSTTAFVKPFLYALSQMHQKGSTSPEECAGRSENHLIQLLGSGDSAIATACVRGSIGLQADHTHYFDGFALMMPLHRGMAVAIAKSDQSASRLFVEGAENVESFSLTDIDNESDSETVRLLKRVVSEFPGQVAPSLDLSLSSGIPGGLLPVFASAFAVALYRALERLTGRVAEDRDRVLTCQRAIESYYGHPFSPAYVRTANIPELNSFVLVDTQSMSFVSLDVGGAEKSGWGIIDSMPGTAPTLPEDRFEIAETIIERLKQKKFKEINSIRDIEHCNFLEAERVLPRKLRSSFRFLVTENRRVQQLVTAIRKRDWQLFGTILLISHEARKKHWRATTSRQDEVVALAERFSHSGVYGATQTGECAFIVAAGQPFSIPGFLDEVREFKYSTSGNSPVTIVL